MKGQRAGIEQRYKNSDMQIISTVDQTATASVCNLRFRGILVGTKSMEAWRATTGRNGEVVRSVNFSRSADAEDTREELVNALPSMSAERPEDDGMVSTRVRKSAVVI